MAEKHLGAAEDRGVPVESDTDSEISSVKQTLKRFSSTSPSIIAPPHKSPRTDFPSPSQLKDSGEVQAENDQQDIQTENMERPSSPAVSPAGRRKSWRRATITRRSLPAIQNPYQVLCRSIDPSLPQQERFEKLCEASVKTEWDLHDRKIFMSCPTTCPTTPLAIERCQNSLQLVPNASMECFQRKVENIQKECDCLAKKIRSESQHHPLPASAVSDPVLQEAMEKYQKAIYRLKAESESWEALFNKHQKKAQDLERKVEQGQEKGLPLDSSTVARSSQYQFITSKPDYHGLLCRQLPMIHNVAMVMETQCKKVRDLRSIKEQCQLLVKETSGRLAAEAGFQALSADVVKNLMTTPLSSAAT